MELIAIGLFLCIIAGYIGRHRLIGFWGFFFLSMVVTPIISLIFLLFTIDKRERVGE
jgi:hypothetical protein